MCCQHPNSVSGNKLSLRLLSAAMNADEQLYFRRQGAWLRIAREWSGKSQAGAAEYLGLSKKSKSSVSDYENGVTPAPVLVLRRLAEWYGVPLTLFTEPRPAPDEVIDEIVRLAGLREQRESDAEAAPGRAADGAQGGGPGRSAA